MPGAPTKTFELEIAPLVPEAADKGLQGNKIAPKLKELLAADRLDGLLNRRIVPLGLRWRVTPALGLPRVAFSVWRRDRRLGDPADVKFESAALSSMHFGGGRFHVPSQPLYILEVAVRNTHPSAAVTVAVLDTANRPIPLQTVEVPANTLRRVRFQHPFVGGFSLRGGSFVVLSVSGVTMKAYIEREDEWKLIEVVGLPAKAGEVTGYDSGQQGDPNEPQSPPDAASTRLKVSQLFYEDLATVLPSGATVPQWGIPTAEEAVDELREGSPSLVQRIDAMLRAVDDSTVNNQAAFRQFETIPGVGQPEFPGQATDDAVIDVPLLATVLLNAVTDTWFALSSGFGTTDFPEPMPPSDRTIEPVSYFDVSHDYMVSAQFVFRLLGVELKREHCALSHRSSFPPVQPAHLVAAPHSLNRPPHRDDPWSAEVALTWAKINRLQIQGNAIAVAHDGLTGAYLNALRPANQTGKLTLFVPAKPGETGDPILHTHNRFFDHGATLPFTGLRTGRYGVAAMDAFGRWSDWSAVQVDLAPRLPEAPRLMSLSLTPDMTRVAGNAVPHELEFEILWDWQDRSAKRFQVAAVFHARHMLPDGTTDGGHVPPDAYPPIFQTDNTATTGPLLKLTFPSDSPTGTAPAAGAIPTSSDPRTTVELLPQATDANGQNVEGEMRRYRVTVTDVNIAFDADDEWFFSLFVKATEWRNPALLSDDTPPLPPNRPPRLTTSVPNPIPPPPPVFAPATILWAGLPDAREVSRFRLAFDRVPNATGGYAVHQAYEAKLCELAGMPTPAGVDLVARATALRDVAMPIARCADAFTRVNAKLVPQPPPGTQVELEVELPGTLDGIVAFSVRSLTREQEASPLSTPWLFVAVPRRAVPAMPILAIAGGQNGTATITCDFAKAPTPARVEIHRVRRDFSARDIGTMGLPLHQSEPAAWQALDAQGRAAASPANTARLRFSFADPIVPSWFPYLYRAVSIGAGDDAVGLVPGRSLQSNLVTVERLPTGLPTIEGLEGEQTAAQEITLRFRSDAAIETTPRGSFRLEVSSFDIAHAQFADEPVLSVLLPRAEPRPATGALVQGVVYAGEPDAPSIRTFEVPLDVVGEQYLFRVRVTDPLGRTSERTISGDVEPDVAPDLRGLRLRRVERDLFVLFSSSSPTERPARGEYRLEISVIRTVGGTATRVLAAALHEILEGDLGSLPTAVVTTLLRSASTPPGQPDAYGAVLKGFFPPGPLPVPRRTVRVRLTGPDGTSVQLQAET